MNKLNILVFGYLRPQKLYDCLTSLQANSLFYNSTLTICIDGLTDAANDVQKQKQQELINIANSIKWCKTVEVVLNESNFGIKRQYFSKIEYALTKADHVVVLEEDTIVGAYFLDYMKNAFERFANSENVILISASVYEINSIPKKNSSYFIIGSGNKAFGFSKTHWQNVDQTCTGYEILKYDKQARKDYNAPGVDVAAILIDEVENNRNNSWDSVIHWNSFAKQLLVLCPDRTLAIDNGWGQDATNAIGINLFKEDAFNPEYRITDFPAEAKENKIYKRKILNFFKFTLRLRFCKKKLLLHLDSINKKLKLLK